MFIFILDIKINKQKYIENLKEIVLSRDQQNNFKEIIND